jgi:hypothetical protein
MTIYVNQNIPPVGNQIANLLPFSTYTIPIKNVKIEKDTENVFIESNINFVFNDNILSLPTQFMNPSINIIRHSHHHDLDVSITNGYQNLMVLLATGATGETGSFGISETTAFNIYDESLKKGIYDYDLIILNGNTATTGVTSGSLEDPSDVVSFSISTYAVTLTTIKKNKSTGVITMPPSGTSTAFIPSSNNYSFTIDKVPKRKKYHFYKLTVNAFFAFNPGNTPLIDISIQRSNGDQVLNSNQHLLKFTGDVFLKFDLGINLSVVDMLPSDSYTVTFINNSLMDVPIGYYSTVIELIDKRSFNQDYPLLGADDALSIAPYNIVSIPLTVNVKKDTKKIKLIFTGDVYNNEQGNILYNIRREDKSLMNNAQLYGVLQIDLPYLYPFEYNNTVMVVDEQPEKGLRNYYLDIISLDNQTINCDYYCFTAQQK